MWSFCRRFHFYSISVFSSHILRLRMEPVAVSDGDQHSSGFLKLISNKSIAFKELSEHIGIQIWCLKKKNPELYILPNSNRPKEDWQEQILELDPQITKYRKNKNTGITRRFKARHQLGGNINITRARKSEMFRTVTQQRDHCLHVVSSTFFGLCS